MKNLAVVLEHADQLSVYFNVESDEVLAISEKMTAINESAYMNGYNWDAFLNHYMQIYQSELLNGLDTDPEAGTYTALYNKGDVDKASRLVDVINGLVNNPDRVYEFLREHGDSIEWE